MKKVIIVVFTVLCCLPIFPVHTKAAENSNDIITYADAKEWRYKFVDKQTYKRLYNLSKKRWEGPWIKV